MPKKEPCISKEMRQHLNCVNFLRGQGNAKPQEWRMATRGYVDPRTLAAPFSEYLQEVHRFLFGGGVRFDVVDAGPDDDRQMVLNAIAAGNSLDPMLQTIWEQAAITGKVLILWLPSRGPKLYQLKVFNGYEFKSIPGVEGGYEMSYVGTDGLWHFKEVDRLSYREYEPSEQWKDDWGLPVVEYEHGYPFTPAQVLLNKAEDPKGLVSGSDFDQTAIDLGIEYALQFLDAASNAHFFGRPIVVSPDPRETLQALRRRSGVLQGSNMKTDQQPLEVLEPASMPSNHRELRRDLKENLYNHLGISVVPDDIPAQTSSVTLKMLYSETIGKAEAKMSTLGEGLRKMLEGLLYSAAFDGVLGNVFYDPGSPLVTIGRQHPYFTPSPQEKLALAGLVESLIATGVKPEFALQEYYPGLTQEQLQERLVGF